MKSLFIATTNPAKFEEINFFLKKILVKFSLRILNIQDLNLDLAYAPKETGKTFEENAIIKAKFYFEKTGITTLADDGGIEIDYFNGKPGVLSRRWIGGKETSDEKLIEYTLKQMQGLPYRERKAQLRCVLALAVSSKKIFTAEGKIRGIIANKIGVYIPGYPYRALFYIPQIKKYYDQQTLTLDEYQKYSHRGRAVKKLIPYIKKYVL